MSLLQTIKGDSLYARKHKLPESNLLVTLYGEASMIGKNNGNRETTDQEVIATLKKFKDGAQTIIEAASVINNEKSPSRIKTAEFEISILDRYLPEMLTTEELNSYIITMVECTNNPTIGTIMVGLKKLFAGRFDGSVASSIVKELLTDHI